MDKTLVLDIYRTSNSLAYRFDLVFEKILIFRKTLKILKIKHTQARLQILKKRAALKKTLNLPWRKQFSIKFFFLSALSNTRSRTIAFFEHHVRKRLNFKLSLIIFRIKRVIKQAAEQRVGNCADRSPSSKHTRAREVSRSTPCKWDKCAEIYRPPPPFYKRCLNNPRIDEHAEINPYLEILTSRAAISKSFVPPSLPFFFFHPYTTTILKFCPSRHIETWSNKNCKLINCAGGFFFHASFVLRASFYFYDDDIFQCSGRGVKLRRKSKEGGVT